MKRTLEADVKRALTGPRGPTEEALTIYYREMLYLILSPCLNENSSKSVEDAGHCPDDQVVHGQALDTSLDVDQSAK